MARPATQLSDTDNASQWPTDAPAASASTGSHRPTAPDGMTYNRKGVLVKKRVQTPRNNNLFLVMQATDNEGNALTKKNIKVLATHRNSDKVLEMIDSGDYDSAFYLRVALTQPK